MPEELVILEQRSALNVHIFSYDCGHIFVLLFHILLLILFLNILQKNM